MEIAALGTGIGRIILKYINKKLQHKADKHQQILILSESKLNTIHNHIFKAVEDGVISEEEFKLILEEENKFREMKEEIRKQTTKVNTIYLNQLHKEKDELMQKKRIFLESK